MRKLLVGVLVAIVMGMSAGSAYADQKFEKPDDQNTKTYIVIVGDSLSKIAETYGLSSWLPLWNANTKLTDPNIINPGDELVIPDGPTTDRALPTPAVAPVQTAAPKTNPRSAAVRKAAPSGDIFARIRMRESGGNYATNTGNGYYGAYQFDVGTWNNYGGYKYASDAPPAVQDAKAADTYARRGCNPWPNTCS